MCTSLPAIFLIALPIVFLACALEMLVASFVRSTKEASTYLPYLALLPSLAGLALAFFPVKPALWTMLIPTFGQQILIYQLIRQRAGQALGRRHCHCRNDPGLHRVYAAGRLVIQS